MIFCRRFILVTVFISLLFPFNATGNGIRNVDGGIELRNSLVSIMISDKADLVSCIDLKSKIDIAAHDYRKIASITTSNGKLIEASKVALSGNIISLTIGNVEVDLEIGIYDHYFTVEVKNEHIAEVQSLYFFDLRLRYNYSVPNCFLATGVAMSLQTNPCFYPSGESKAVCGMCTTHTGIKGAKMAVIACEKRDLRKILKEVYTSVPFFSVPFNTVCGAFSQDSKMNSRDGLILNDVAPSNIEALISFCSQHGIGQLDFEIGPKTFIQGQFSFPNYGTAKEFRQQIVDPLYKAGIISSLHTYSYYISYGANELLSDPKWQQQLEFREVFKLAKRISETDKSITLSGDKSILRSEVSFWTNHSPYLLIDNEIIKYSISGNTIVALVRGQCGTKTSEHKAGAVVRLIGGYYSHIAPQPGSDLYYEIAHRTAKAYNEGGFRGIYFDALDGLGMHLKYDGLGDYTWYYGAAFINEVLRYCDEPPVVEGATLYPSIWAARGRGGAWDTPNRGYKRFIDEHISVNQTLMDRHYITTLGWWNLYPKLLNEPYGYSTKYMFVDDIDYLGTKCIAYDQVMVYGKLKKDEVDTVPGLQRNLKVFDQYNRLREKSYFSERVKKLLREGQYEYKLLKKSGRWAFREVQYCRKELHDINDSKLIGSNPFGLQYPFIRIENLYSSEVNNVVNLMKFNESKDVIGQNMKKEFSKVLNLENNRGIKISIRGNGVDSKDAVCIRLRGNSAVSGFSDYVVETNFDGWKDILLTNIDNAEYPSLRFMGKEDILYNYYRYKLDYTQINTIQVFTSGECKGVRIKSIDAVPLYPNDLVNPTVTIGVNAITFSDIIKSGEYIEYEGKGETALVYDSMGNSRTIPIVKRGRLRVPNGRFQAKVTGEPELKDSPAEAILTLGFFGKYIHN